jgi:hypothetical protein
LLETLAESSISKTISSQAVEILKVQRLSRKGVHRKRLAVEMVGILKKDCDIV